MEGELWEYLVLTFIFSLSTLAIGFVLSFPVRRAWRLFRRWRKINYLPRAVRRRRYAPLRPCKACDTPGATSQITFNGGAREWICKFCRNWFHRRDYGTVEPPPVELVDSFPDIAVLCGVVPDPFHDVELLESRAKHWGLSRNEDETNDELRIRLGAHVLEECRKYGDEEFH